MRHLIPSSAVENATPRLLVDTTPLLEMEGNALFYASISDRAHPLNRHRSSSESSLYTIRSKRLGVSKNCTPPFEGPFAQHLAPQKLPKSRSRKSNFSASCQPTY